MLLTMAGSVWIFWNAVRRSTQWSRLGGAGRGVRPGTLEELEARAVVTGSREARLDLADALEEHDRAEEAATLYRELLEERPRSLRALHGLARALLSLHRPAEAVEALERVVEADRAFRGYSAALDYAEALWQSERRSDALELLAAMAATTGRMNHRVAHAHYLTEAGRHSAARAVLTEALSAYEQFQFTDKRRQQYWAVRAEQMLEELSELPA